MRRRSLVHCVRCCRSEYAQPFQVDLQLHFSALCLLSTNSPSVFRVALCCASYARSCRVPLCDASLILFARSAQMQTLNHRFRLSSLFLLSHASPPLDPDRLPSSIESLSLNTDRASKHTHSPSHTFSHTHTSQERTKGQIQNARRINMRRPDQHEQGKLKAFPPRSNIPPPAPPSNLIRKVRRSSRKTARGGEEVEGWKRKQERVRSRIRQARSPQRPKADG